VAEIWERHNRLIGDIDHTLKGNVWMGKFLKRMGQDHDIEPIGCEAMQAIVDIFLNNIQPFTRWCDQIVRVYIDAYADGAAFVSEARQKRAISTAEVQDSAACGNPVQYGFEI